jgi:hypothetical protein
MLIKRQTLLVFMMILLTATISPWLWAKSTSMSNMTERQKKIVKSAQEILENYEISYVMGGTKIGDKEDCDKCNACLGEKSPKPQERLKSCPMCLYCSLDCSHFLNHVFTKAGFSVPYLNTDTMLKETPERLKRLYRLQEVLVDVMYAEPGDLLVYFGHVVMLEKNDGNGRGDVIHATSGRELKGPGAGIQRDRKANLKYFRGPLQRILRVAAAKT